MLGQSTGRNLVGLSDATVFEAPSRMAWDVIVGVANGLRLQLDDAAFETAIDQLATHLSAWPDGERICPLAWLPLYFREPCDPRVRLVRALFLPAALFGSPQSAAVWLQELARSRHLQHVSTLIVSNFGKQKATLNSLEALFRAVKPGYAGISCHLRGLSEEPIVAHLSAAGVLPPGKSSDVSIIARESVTTTLDVPHVHVDVEDGKTLLELLGRAELDHVVSLSLTIRSTPDFEAPSSQVLPASLRNLRHLVLRTWSHNQRIRSPLVTWLSNARPIVIECFNFPALLLAQQGVYARAYGSVLTLGDGEDDLDEVAAASVLASGEVCVGGLDGASGFRDTSSWTKRMHPRTREALLALRWPVSVEDYERLEACIGALPQLGCWMPTAPVEELPGKRLGLLEKIAASPATRQLALLAPCIHTRDPLFHLDKAQARVLDKGVGTRAYAYLPNYSTGLPRRLD